MHDGFPWFGENVEEEATCAVCGEPVRLGHDGESEEEPPDPIRREAPKIGRNDPCPCGSGRKHKKCCGR